MSFFVRLNGSTTSEPSDYGPCAISAKHRTVGSCKVGDACIGGHFCHTNQTDDGQSGYYVQGCSDKTFSDRPCVSLCEGSSVADIVYDDDKKIWTCCGEKDGKVQCDSPLGETFHGRNPSLMRTQWLVVATDRGALPDEPFQTAAADASGTADLSALVTADASHSAAIGSASGSGAQYTAAAATSSSSSSASPSSHHGLSTGGVIGVIIMSIIIFFTMVALGVYFFVRHRRKHRGSVLRGESTDRGRGLYAAELGANKGNGPKGHWDPEMSMAPGTTTGASSASRLSENNAAEMASVGNRGHVPSSNYGSADDVEKATEAGVSPTTTGTAAAAQRASTSSQHQIPRKEVPSRKTSLVPTDAGNSKSHQNPAAAITAAIAAAAASSTAGGIFGGHPKRPAASRSTTGGSKPISKSSISGPVLVSGNPLAAQQNGGVGASPMSANPIVGGAFVPAMPSQPAAAASKYHQRSSSNNSQNESARGRRSSSIATADLDIRFSEDRKRLGMQDSDETGVSTEIRAGRRESEDGGGIFKSFRKKP